VVNRSSERATLGRKALSAALWAQREFTEAIIGLATPPRSASAIANRASRREPVLYSIVAPCDGCSS